LLSVPLDGHLPVPLASCSSRSGDGSLEARRRWARIDRARADRTESCRASRPWNAGARPPEGEPDDRSRRGRDVSPSVCRSKTPRIRPRRRLLRETFRVTSCWQRTKTSASGRRSAQLDEDAKRWPLRDLARNGRIRWDFGQPDRRIPPSPPLLPTTFPRDSPLLARDEISPP
jgi:hypothetical protein